ncbi:MAG: SHOCT domain-containing protein [Clostridia bacterium]|nr:SHOCT domain-containing protein [Clostridia bacterium]
MKSKKATVILTILFLLFVVALPTICVFIPYQEPYFVYETTDIYYYEDEESGTVDYYLVGEFVNPTVCTFHKVSFDVTFYDEFTDELLGKYSLVIDEDIAGGSTYQIEESIIIPYFENENVWWGIENVEYEYSVLSPVIYYGIGFIVFNIATLFFTKKKFFFQVGGSEVEVLAGMRKATLVVDGKVQKQLLVKNRFQTDSCTFKIGDQQLALTLNMGYYLPKIKITVDGVIPKFTKIQQHAFLKVTKNQAQGSELLQTAPAQQSTATGKTTTSKSTATTTKKTSTETTSVKTKRQEKLEKIETLYKQGLITDEEYKEWKAKLEN